MDRLRFRNRRPCGTSNQAQDNCLYVRFPKVNDKHLVSYEIGGCSKSFHSMFKNDLVNSAAFREVDGKPAAS